MVTAESLAPLVIDLLAAEQAVEPLIRRLDPPRRAIVIMTIIALVLTGLLLVTCVMIGGRWVRRLARHGHGRTTRTMHIENQRLRDALRPILPDGPPGETTIAKRTTDETVADS